MLNISNVMSGHVQAADMRPTTKGDRRIFTIGAGASVGSYQSLLTYHLFHVLPKLLQSHLHFLGGGSEYRVTWKVEEAVHNFVHAD